MLTADIQTMSRGQIRQAYVNSTFYIKLRGDRNEHMKWSEMTPWCLFYVCTHPVHACRMPSHVKLIVSFAHFISSRGCEYVCSRVCALTQLLLLSVFLGHVWEDYIYPLAHPSFPPRYWRTCRNDLYQQHFPCPSFICNLGAVSEVKKSYVFIYKWLKIIQVKFMMIQINTT